MLQNTDTGSTLQINTPRWAVPVVSGAARYKGAHGGRGSGKSHLFGEHLIELCSIQKIDAVCVREIQKSLNQSVKKLLENKIGSVHGSGMLTVRDVFDAVSGVFASHETWLGVLAAAVMIFGAIRIRRFRDDS